MPEVATDKSSLRVRAHFVTETRMSGSPEAVTEFMDKIRERLEAGKIDRNTLHFEKRIHA